MSTDTPVIVSVCLKFLLFITSDWVYKEKAVYFGCQTAQSGV